MFDRQIEVATDPSQFVAVLCPRRAGKTQIWVRLMTVAALMKPGCLIRIWGISRLRCKQLIWDELKKLCIRHQVATELDFNETELELRLSNGSMIRLLGADKLKEADKKRGDKTFIEIIMEAQMFGSSLKTIVEDIAGPCLLDERGTFYLEGTPGIVCGGYWYEVTGREEDASRWISIGGKDGIGAGWSCHHWDTTDNPHMPHAREDIAKMKARHRWEDDNPTYVREWLGRWVNDFGALFYKFSPTRNIYNPDEIQPWGDGWEHILGWDLGFRDDMALVAWGFHPKYPDLYEAHSWKQPGALAAEVMGQIQALEQRGFNFIVKVADTGGGGKMYVEEVMSRYEQHFEAAKKPDKYEHVRLLNDDLLTGHIKLRPGSPLMEEMAALPKDPNWPPEDKPEAPPREHPTFANHCCDAGLYSYRASRHYLHRPEVEKPKQGTAAFHAAWESDLVTRLEEAEHKRKNASWDDLPDEQPPHPLEEVLSGLFD
jgi:hypothetical protein